MATIIDLKKSINRILKSNFFDTPVLSNDVKEGFRKPCFSTNIIPLTSDNDTVNYSSHRAMIVVNYFSDVKGQGRELDNLKKDADLRLAFGMNLKVNQRSFLIKNIRSEIIDEVLQFRFDLDFLVSSDRKENLEDGTDYDLMQEINLDLKRRD